MRSDLANNISPVQSLAPAVHTEETAGAAVDLAGFDSAVALVAVGAVTGSMEISVEHSDADDSGFQPVPTSEADGTPVLELAASSGNNQVHRIGYHGIKRYLRISVTDDTGTNVAAGGVVVRGKARHLPK